MPQTAHYFFVFLACCSSNSSPGPVTAPVRVVDASIDVVRIDPDTEEEKRLNELTIDEQKALCDWSATLGGGYGVETTCDGGATVATARDQAACIAQFPNGCKTVTVTEFEVCRRKEASAVCSFLLYSDLECAELYTCIGNTKTKEQETNQ